MNSLIYKINYNNMIGGARPNNLSYYNQYACASKTKSYVCKDEDKNCIIITRLIDQLLRKIKSNNITVIMDDNNLNPIYIPTQEAYNLYYQCSTSGCTSQQYSDLFSEHLVATDSAQVEMTDNDIWDDGELTTDNISDTNNYSICECYNNLNE